MKDVVVFLFPDVLMLDVAGPIEVFSLANRYLPQADAYRISTVAAEANGVRASNGIFMQVDSACTETTQSPHLLLVPGGPGAYAGNHDTAIQWLTRVAHAATRFGSICTGAFILGEAGLLDGHRVTTHWNYHDRLAKRFPNANVETDQIVVMDDRLVSCGGITAGIDLALEILVQDHGKALALTVAKVLLVVMKREGGQAQFSPLLIREAEGNTAVMRVMSHVQQHLKDDFSVEQMAELAAISPRSLARVFMREIDTTPMAFLQKARVDHARTLLESSTLPLKTVAHDSGFGNTRRMYGAFRKFLGLSPAEYRRRFSAQ